MVFDHYRVRSFIVNSVGYLGHTPQQDCTMNLDAKHKRAVFIDKSSDIRVVFQFAHPAYGFMLYDLAGQASQSYLMSWNTFVKLIWDVLQSTYTHLVANVLTDKFVPFRKQIYSRYVNFFQNLLTSCTKEIRHLANIVCKIQCVKECLAD